MSEKLQTIMEKIKLGQIKETKGLELTLEEFFSKDSQGISFLEHLLQNKITVSFLDVLKMSKSIEAGYIFLKYDQELFWFNFEEEDLFKEINGERFIDILVKKDKLSSAMIKNIKNNIEIVDILLENNSFMCNYITKDIIEKLMTKDTNGRYYIEKYFDSEDSIIFLIELVNKPKELVELCRKYNKYHLLKLANENVLMYELDENYTLLEDLLKKNIYPDFLKNIPNNINFINFLREKNFYEYLSQSEESVLLIEVEPGKVLLEEIIDKGYKIKPDRMLFKEKTIRILYKKNKLDLATKVDESLLLKSVKEILEEESLDNQTLLEYMLKNGYNPLSNTYSIKDESIIKLFAKRGEWEFLSKKVFEKNLFIEVELGVPLIDKLLEHNLDLMFNYGGFESVEIAKKLYEKKRFDLLADGNLDILMLAADSNNTYLDYILKEVKAKRLKYNLNNISKNSDSLENIGKFYISVAKHDMIEYVKELDEEKLLEKIGNKTLLEELLDLDSQLTIDKIISKRVKSKMKVAIILKARGLDQKDIDVPVQDSKFTKDYLIGVQNTLGIGPLPEYAEDLLKRLEELFLSDGKSDEALVSALVSGYRQALFENYKLNISELENLLEVKSDNLDRFIYVNTEEGAFFSPGKGSVNCERPVVETILHETGHALHHYLIQSEVPEEYLSVVKRIRENPETLEKVEALADKYSKIKEKVRVVIEKKMDSFFKTYYSVQKEREIQKFLQRSLDEKREELKSLGLSEDTLKIILNKSFTLEEYINHQKRIFIDEYKDDILRCNFGSYMAICDILDAIYEGDLNSGVLKNSANEKIKRTAGHGISYYSNTNHGFDEMIANFSSIIKSKNSAEMLNLLKSIIGDELYTMLSQFYFDNIVITKDSELKTL